MASQTTDPRTAGQDPIAFAVERVALAQPGRLEVTGRWYGVRGRRFVRPEVILPSGDVAQGKDGTPREQEVDDAGDSGIYLRGNPQVQIWDPTGPALREGKFIGSGGLYNNKHHPSEPTVVADRPGALPAVVVGPACTFWSPFDDLPDRAATTPMPISAMTTATAIPAAAWRFSVTQPTQPFCDTRIRLAPRPAP